MSCALAWELHRQEWSLLCRRMFDLVRGRITMVRFKVNGEKLVGYCGYCPTEENSISAKESFYLRMSNAEGAEERGVIL